MQTAVSSSVLDRVILAVEQTTLAGHHQVTSGTRLAGDLGLSAFGRIKLAMYLEEIFDAELPDEAMERFVTVADIVAYMAKRYFQDIDLPEAAELA